MILTSFCSASRRRPSKPTAPSKALTAVAALAGLACLAAPAPGQQLLGTGTIYNGGGTTGLFTQMDLTVALGSDPFGMFPTPTPFFQQTIDAQSAGQTFVLNAGQMFTDAIAFLTNGQLDYVHETLRPPSGGGGGSSRGETSFFNFASCLTGVDFQGTTIDRLELRIDSFSITPGSFTSFQLAATLEVYGACPAPSASCTFRNGSGTNPTGFDCTTDPVVGTNWDSTIATTLSTLSTLLGLSATGSQFPYLGGEILIGVAPTAAFLPGAGSYSLPIPDDPTLLGVPLFAQGFRVELVGSTATLVMLNAQDLVLGQ
ncbi:MAG: hypothetical protein AAF628_36435 [Planctomycetota bacterium]